MSYEIANVRLSTRIPSGHEQEGHRPALVLADFAIIGPTRFPMVVIAPLTTYRDQQWQSANPSLYPVLPAGAAGLNVQSIILLDQLQAIDATRVFSLRGTLTTDEAEPILAELRKIFTR